MQVSITVKKVKHPPLFTDASVCSDKSSDIVLTINDPDKGDDFEIGDVIPIKVKIKNNFEEDKEFDIEVHLYDITEEQSVNDIEDNLDIDKKDTETFEKEIKIPKDADNKDDEYAIYVYIEDEDGYCTSAYAEIDVKRKKDDLSISKFEISPLMQEAGKLIEFIIRVDNLGSKDQDEVYVKVENKDLGLSLVSDKFDIEKYDEDDTMTKQFSFAIPKSINEGSYEIKASVFYSDDTEADSETKQLSVVKKVQPTIPTKTIVKQTEGTIYLIQPTTKPTDNLILTYPAQETQIRVVAEKPAEVRYYLTSNLKSVMDDSLIKILVIIFDVVLLVGSVILFIRAVVYVSRR